MLYAGGDHFFFSARVASSSYDRAISSINVFDMSSSCSATFRHSAARRLHCRGSNADKFIEGKQKDSDEVQPCEPEPKKDVPPCPVERLEGLGEPSPQRGLVAMDCKPSRGKGMQTLNPACLVPMCKE